MNSDQIDWILRRNVGSEFLGVFSADTIPNLTFFPCCYVVNTDPASLPGKHWVAYYHVSFKAHEFFDSFGEHPSSFSLPTYPNLIYNQKSIQSLTSNVCGQFCVFFMYQRCHSLSLSRIVTILSNVRDPDQYVCTFVCRLDSRIPHQYCTRNCQCSIARNKFI